MASDVPYGERGYLIDRKGEITPINDMYGHEAFVKKRSKEYISPINFVADNGWVLVQTVSDHSVITLCDETVTKQALAGTLKAIGAHHRQDKITVTNYNRDTDIENQLISYATYIQMTRLFIKLKSGAETASFLKVAEIASRDIKLSILEEKAKILILQKNFRVFHEIKINPSEGKETVYTNNEGKQTRYFTRSWDYLWALIVNADPTKNKQYLQWIITKALKNNSDWRVKRFSYWKEDLESTRFKLEKFDEFKRKNKLPPEFRDIQKIRDDDELFEFVNGLESKLEEEVLGSIEDQEKKFFDNKEAEIYYESSKIRIIVPKTHEASCFFGRKTNWCTAIPKRPEIFGDYSVDSPLYIIENKATKDKWQFHFHSHQFMDEIDRLIDFVELHTNNKHLIKELINVFDAEANKYGVITLMKSPTINSLIASISVMASIYSVIKIMANHATKKFNRKDKLNFLHKLATYLSESYGLSWFQTGTAEEALSYLFGIQRSEFINKFPFIVLESNMSKDLARNLIIKVSRNAPKDILDKVDKAFQKKFGEYFYIHT